MKLRGYIGILIFALLGGAGARAQVTIRNQSEYDVLRATPMETLYAHTTASLVFPGEYLYFSLYAINLQTYRLSSVSSMAYLQLVGEDGTIYARSKVRMRGGRGQGDLFIGTDFPSGAYKLVAYTNWMRNAGPGQVYAADITVLNPYQRNQEALLGEGTSDPFSPDPAPEPDIQVGEDGLMLETDSTRYAQRSWVTLNLRNFRGARGHGHYSLSVTRMPDLPVPPQSSAEDYAGNYTAMLRELPQGIGDRVAIPEQRGELIGGQLLDSAGPVPNAWLGISFPGESFQLKAALTDSTGWYFTYLNTPYNGRRWIARVLEPGSDAYKFSSFSPLEDPQSPGDYFHIRIDTSMREAILKRSIHNQVENSYYEIKPDTVVAQPAEDPFFPEIPDIYQLDEFTRFATLQETLLEIVRHVWIRRESDGGYTFWVRAPDDPDDTEYTTDPPLVTVDGLLVPDHNNLLGLDARQIRTIKVYREKRNFGPRDYQGVVVIETIGGDYPDTWSSPSGRIFRYEPPEAPKAYFRQGEGMPNIPDFRYQLLWEPRIEMDGSLREFRFRTSDVPGTYRIRLEGYTSYGKPVTLNTYIEVIEAD
ncbi:hypothetical protein [Robiginitalea sp. SC105]|uniref:hypothetical protein n=1 Tax=Robiginitalea sp. SC105 TaxID=2762332 RepID=UPI00163A3256|nr:hypothetical protein [Robiginitalea sp. SC105]MBC2840443.1 hypothetical protein [Robiginitalea sp. SC105]